MLMIPGCFAWLGVINRLLSGAGVESRVWFSCWAGVNQIEVSQEERSCEIKRYGSDTSPTSHFHSVFIQVINSDLIPSV